MHANKPAILITREIDKLLVGEIIAKSFAFDIIPFIETKIITTKKIQQQIKKVLPENATVIFTSVNAVKAVGEYVRLKNHAWKIYCTGNTTKALAEKIFGKDAV